MHTLQYEHVLTCWCNVNIPVHICDMLCLIKYIFFQYIIIVCTLVWYDIMIHAANISGIMLFFHVIATKTYMYKDNF